MRKLNKILKKEFKKHLYVSLHTVDEIETLYDKNGWTITRLKRSIFDNGYEYIITLLYNGIEINKSSFYASNTEKKSVIKKVIDEHAIYLLLENSQLK